MAIRWTAFLVAVMALAEPVARPEFVHAVEFPYYLYPRQSWERELVWLKGIGVRTVSFSIPWAWHQPEPGSLDLTGRTSPRRDLAGFVKILRTLGMHAWVRPLPPVKGMVNGGWPGVRDTRAQRDWLRELDRLLAPQTVSHGGPVAFVEGKALSIDAPAPPGPVTIVSAVDREALQRSRKAIATGRGALVWEDVEDTLYPAAWATDVAISFRKGAVALSGSERVPTAPLRRAAALLKSWSFLTPTLTPARVPKPAVKFPAGLQVTQLVSPKASAVSIINSGDVLFRSDLRVYEPGSKRAMAIPGVTVGPGESLWLPVSVSLGGGGLCRDCSKLSSAERIIYATAELHSIEYENGIVAMEFAASRPGEAVLQLARQPVGPYLAGGTPTRFDWDEKTLRARLPIPAGQGPGNRVRVGLALEVPETSAFFVDARRLIIGKTNTVSTSYSSAELAARSRLRLPDGWTATSKAKSPVELDYEVEVPAGELHGHWANLAIEADGVPMGTARLQMFRPLSVRFPDAVRIRFGADAELPVEPAVIPADARAGRSIDVVIRNNSTGIETYRIDASGAGLSFSPPGSEISIGPVMERTVSLRVFPESGEGSLRDARLRITGAATLDVPLRIVLIPRGHTGLWKADLDGDGSVEWVLESHRVRAVFSSRDGGRWTEFTWKDTGTDVLPENGAWAVPENVAVTAATAALEFRTSAWKRTVRLEDNRLIVEQTPSLPAVSPPEGKHGTVTLKVARESDTRAVYSLN